MFGQQLCVIGSLHQLGDWTEFLGKMHWTNSHVWKFKMVCQMNQSFEYKYIILNQDKVTQKWESGENRVMDLSENIEKRLSVNETFRK